MLSSGAVYYAVQSDFIVILVDMFVDIDETPEVWQTVFNNTVPHMLFVKSPRSMP